MDVLTRPELLRLLGSRGAVAAALQEGSWQRVFRGAYVPRAPDIGTDLALRAAAALRVLPPRSLVADRTLLRLLGIDVLPPGPPLLEVVVPRGAPVPRRAGIAARSTDLPRGDRMVLRGLPSLQPRPAGPGGPDGSGSLPVLRPARAAADLLRRLPHVEAVVVADAVQHAGLLTSRQLLVELGSQGGRRGVREAGRAVARSDGRAESPPETRLRLLLHDAGLLLQPQLVVRDGSGPLIARVDLGDERARVAVEYDGRTVHLQGDAFVPDRRRQNDLVAAGWVVLRYTASDLALRPHAIVSEVRAALARVVVP